MAERLPEQVFNRPPLREEPRVITRPGRDEVIRTYNLVFSRFMNQREGLEQRLANGEFSALSGIAERLDRGEALSVEDRTLIDDYAQLIDARTAFYGRRNLNGADAVSEIMELNSLGLPLTAEQQEIIVHYQNQDFHLMPGVDHPLRQNIRVDRFQVTAKNKTDEGEKIPSLIDGAPVEGLIRFIDGEIASSPEGSREYYRRQRDILYTSSVPLTEELRDPDLIHARKELEAYYNYVDEVRSQWILPDWFNGENVLRERRILNIPPQRGRNRLGCLPLLLPIPLLLLWGVQVNTNPCAGTGGQLRVEVFTPWDAEGTHMSGSIAREMVALREGISQNTLVLKDDPRIVAGRDRLYSEELDYYNEYQAVGQRDYIQTAQRLRGDNERDEWVTERVTDFEDRRILASCLSPEQRDQKTRENLERRANPQWWHPIADLLTNARNTIPQVRFAIR